MAGTAFAGGVLFAFGAATISDGASVSVPGPSDPSNIVVATFEYPTSLWERLATAVLKPTRAPTVRLDGREHRFVTGTSGSEHLLRVPGGSGVLHGGMQVDHLAFPNASGAVRVRFYEVPLRDA